MARFEKDWMERIENVLDGADFSISVGVSESKVVVFCPILGIFHMGGKRVYGATRSVCNSGP
jgi:hypothetical protein